MIQKCIENAKLENKSNLTEFLIQNSTTLILDQYGNYVIQYILTLKDKSYNRKIIKLLMNDIIFLSKQKYSSNVVEKCFDFCDEITQEELIDSVSSPEIISELIMDMYGNYVIQKALSATKPETQLYMLTVN